jgi:AraC family transcriptional regulator
MHEISTLGIEHIRRLGEPSASGDDLELSYGRSGRSVRAASSDGRPAQADASAKPHTHRDAVGRLLMAAVDLLEAVESHLDGDEDAACERVRRVGTTLGAAPSNEDSGVETPLLQHRPTHSPRGGLAPWQILRVTAHIDSSLQTTITTEDLARIARLSPFHFARAFKQSFGDSPHKYILRRRTERAQGLMLSTDAPLGQIALDCGLADQSHLTRLFQKLVGESPGAWRRARTSGRR